MNSLMCHQSFCCLSRCFHVTVAKWKPTRIISAATQKSPAPRRPQTKKNWFMREIRSYGCFQKKCYPQIIHFNRVFHYKPSILRVLPISLEIWVCILEYLVPCPTGLWEFFCEKINMQSLRCAFPSQNTHSLELVVKLPTDLYPPGAPNVGVYI